MKWVFAPLVVGLLAACGAGGQRGVEPHSCGGAQDRAGEGVGGDDELTQMPYSASFQQAGVFPVDASGRTAEVEVAFGADLRYLAILVTPEPPGVDPAMCFRLEPVALRSGAQWVDGPDQQKTGTAVCSACEQRVYSGHGTGLFLFPNDGKPLPGPDTLVFRVQVRDCTYGILGTQSVFPNLPAGIRVEFATAPEPLGDGALDVHVVQLPGADLDQATWKTAWAVAQGLYSSAGISLNLVQRITMPWGGDGAQDADGAGDEASGGTVAFHDGAYGLLDELYRQAMKEVAASATRPFLPVILVPCLQWTNNLTSATEFLAGFSPRIPGISGAMPYANAVFLATSACKTECGSTQPEAWKTPEQLGLILAHEMGHYLGLYHSDTASGQHRSHDTSPTVMDSGVLAMSPATAAWSRAQMDVLRRHPDVRIDVEGADSASGSPTLPGGGGGAP